MTGSFARHAAALHRPRKDGGGTISGTRGLQANFPGWSHDEKYRDHLYGACRCGIHPGVYSHAFGGDEFMTSLDRTCPFTMFSPMASPCQRERCMAWVPACDVYMEQGGIGEYMQDCPAFGDSCKKMPCCSGYCNLIWGNHR